MSCNEFTFNIPADTPQEAEKKAEALAVLATQLSAAELSALAAKVPAILRDPFKSKMVKSYLGL